MKAENIELDTLVDQAVKLPNGEIMSLYSLKEGVIFYGVSMESDDFVRSPLFNNPGDALLHCLEPLYLNESLTFVSAETPANSKSSTSFHFVRGLKLYEYVMELRTPYYDARGKVRPPCLGIGNANFKIDYLLKLPLGKSQANPDPTGQSIDNILSVIKGIKDELGVGGQGVNRPLSQGLMIEAYALCNPGKVLTIRKSLAIDLGTLWTFYAGLLGKGLGANAIRNQAFISQPKAQAVITAIVKESIVPSKIGDIPKDISVAIANNENLDVLLERCSASTLGKKICTAGSFFQKLWDRDVISMTKVFTFDPKPAREGDKWIPIGIKKHATDGYEVSLYSDRWFFKEDFMAEMGKDVLAYNWNYNRFLDVNTVMYYLLTNLARGRVLINLPTTKEYDVNKHLAVIRDGKKYRMSDKVGENKIQRLKGVKMYDSVGDVELVLSFNPVDKGINFNLLSIAAAGGLETANNANGKNNSVGMRAKTVISAIETVIGDTIAKVNSGAKTSFKLNKGYGPNFWILQFADPKAVTVIGEGVAIPTNYFVLVIVDTIVRYLITMQDFTHFSFI